MLRWLPAAEEEALMAQGTTAYRLADSPGLWLERFGEVLLISSLREHDARRALSQIGQNHVSVYWRRLVPSPGPQDRPVHLAGPPLQAPIIATEQAVRYELDFLHGYNCGLFLDQRANRARLAALAPRRVLNLFAYTCSFSLRAALAGAETLSIDLARAALERGKANFALNAVPLQGHRFLADDVFDVLPRLARRGERFDAIILDPPTFSRGKKGRVFRAAEHMEHLLRLATACATPGAHLLLSTNAATLHIRHLAAWAKTVGGWDFHTEPPLPDIAPARAAKTLWFRCGEDGSTPLSFCALQS